MGYWKSEHGIIGDSVADVVDKFFEGSDRKMTQGQWVGRLSTPSGEMDDEFDSLITEVFETLWMETLREMTWGELGDLIEFCTGGTFKLTCKNPSLSMAEHNQFQVKCGNKRRIFNKRVYSKEGYPKAVECGLQGAMGPASLEYAEKHGGFVNADPQQK